MILADTSVWFDHLRRRDPRLRAALEAHQICIHPMVVGELACSNLRSRAILAHLHLLPPTTLATHDEALAMIEQHKLMARGVEFVDAHTGFGKTIKRIAVDARRTTGGDSGRIRNRRSSKRATPTAEKFESALC